MRFYLIMGVGFLALLLVYYFSYQIQVWMVRLIHVITESIGKSSKTGQFELERYVFMHRHSAVARVYDFVNNLLVTMNLKVVGVTPLGFLLFWSILGAIVGFFLTILLDLSFVTYPIFVVIIVVFELVMIRVSIADKMEKREACVMDAIDLIIPELRNGVYNAIRTHKNNFASILQDAFNEFDVNMNRRKMPFRESMIVLSDRLGVVFRDFAQQAITYEQSGEDEMLDIFAEVVETNRLRRELRDINNKKFSEKRRDFVISTVILIAYAWYTIITSPFTRHFLMETDGGKFLVIFMILDTISVLAYMSTLKSKSL